MNRKLDAFSVAALLVSVHYGLGFLLGTGEKAFTLGIGGSLYAISTSLGLLALLVLVKFYWNTVEPIWNLLGDRYGNQVKIILGLMSWSWMIGVVASQILGGAFILKVLGMPVYSTMIILAILIMLISLLPVEQASRIFQALLILSSLSLVYALSSVHGWSDYWRSPIDFIPALTKINHGELVGVPLTTILLTAIGMDFQQFIVQAKDIKSAYQGCFLAALILLFLAFLPSAVVVAASNSGILPSNIDAKEAIPLILAWVGSGVNQTLGIILILSLVVMAIGSGGSVLRVMNQTIFDFTGWNLSLRNQLLIALGNTFLIFLIAFTGNSIINLIIDFYAIYIAGVLVPFLAYLLDVRGKYTFSDYSIWLSLILGSLLSAIMLFITRIFPETIILNSPEINILIIGMTFSILGLSLGKILDKKIPTYQLAVESPKAEE